jgi:hypothetical protein
MKNSTRLQDPLGKLAELDQLIASTSHGPLSLNPAVPRATSLVALVSGLADPRQRAMLAAGSYEVAAALIDSFPENLFWDFDYLLASVHRGAVGDGDYEAGVRKRAELLGELMALYGQRSVIRFRYAHDFVYGFDWARWVRRDPEHRAQIGPFDLAFMYQSKERGRDLMELIAGDDEHYHRLAPGEVRNPFPFAREPGQELRLWRLLAAEGSIPTCAWDLHAEPVWDRDFDALREAAAARLDL